MAPELQKQAEELKRSQLEDKLASKLETRPRPSELVDQHILHGKFAATLGPFRPHFLCVVAHNTKWKLNDFYLFYFFGHHLSIGGGFNVVKYGC